MHKTTRFQRINRLLRYAHATQQRRVPRVPAPVLIVLEGLSALFAVPVARPPLAGPATALGSTVAGMGALLWKLAMRAPLTEVESEGRKWHHWDTHRIHPIRRWLPLLDTWWSRFERATSHPNPFWYGDMHVMVSDYEPQIWSCFEASAAHNYGLQAI